MGASLLRPSIHHLVPPVLLGSLDTMESKVHKVCKESLDQKATRVIGVQQEHLEGTVRMV
jgi:hypothetical protein